MASWMDIVVAVVFACIFSLYLYALWRRRSHRRVKHGASSVIKQLIKTENAPVFERTLPSPTHSRESIAVPSGMHVRLGPALPGGSVVQDAITARHRIATSAATVWSSNPNSAGLGTGISRGNEAIIVCPQRPQSQVLPTQRDTVYAPTVAEVAPLTSSITATPPCGSSIRSASTAVHAQPGTSTNSDTGPITRLFQTPESSAPASAATIGVRTTSGSPRVQQSSSLVGASTRDKPSTNRSILLNQTTAHNSRQSAQNVATSATSRRGVGLPKRFDNKEETIDNPNRRAPPTPICVIHPPQPRRGHVRQHQRCEEEWNNLSSPSSSSSEEVEEEEEEEDEGACLDLRGLTVREALAAVEVILPRQDQDFIDSDFDESRRFVYIVTGWGKLSPGQVPKLKPAVEQLLNSTTYKLRYEYTWTNGGEMEVDLIGRQREADLRRRSEERRRQRDRGGRTTVKTVHLMRKRVTPK